MKELTLEKDDTASLLVVEPTLIADEMQLGALMAFVKPSSPDAMTVAIFAERRVSIADFMGASVVSQGLECGSFTCSRLRLTEAIFRVDRRR
jgi:hypothetical protein